MPGNPFNSITELIEDLLNSHLDKGPLGEIQKTQKVLLDGQEKIQSDLLAIRAYLGVPNTEAVRPDQVAAIAEANASLDKSQGELQSAVEHANPQQ